MDHYSLEKLPGRCSSLQMYILQERLTQSVKKIDLIKKFPIEISTRIFELLNLSTLKNVLQVSKHWNRVCRSDIIWKTKIKELDYPLKHNAKKILNSYFELCKHYIIRDIRWKFMSNEFVTHFKAHTSKITCMMLRGDYVVSASEDRTVCVWQISNNQHIFQTRPDHAEPLDALYLETPVASCLDFYPEKTILAIGTFNRVVQIIYLDSRREVTLNHHTGSITCIRIVYPYLLIGSSDSKISMYDIENEIVAHEFRDHADAISNLDANDSFMVSGARDQTLCVFDLKEKCLISTIRVSDAPENIKLKNNNMYIFNLGSSIRRSESSYGLDGGPPVSTSRHINYHNVKSIGMNHKFLISLSVDRVYNIMKLHVLDLDTLRIRNDMVCPNPRASLMDLDDDKIVLANDDGTLSVISFVPANLL